MQRSLCWESAFRASQRLHVSDPQSQSPGLATTLMTKEEGSIQLAGRDVDPLWCLSLIPINSRQPDRFGRQVTENPVFREVQQWPKAATIHLPLKTAKMRAFLARPGEKTNAKSWFGMHLQFPNTIR